MYLSDDELADLVGDLSAVIAPRLENEPGGDRKRRLLSTVLMPRPDATAPPARPDGP